MANAENFDISKACILSDIYKKNRKVARKKFVDELISYQNFFGTLSIVGAKLSIPRLYRRSTVESVLNDLGYKLDDFNTSIQQDLYGGTYGRDTNFSFSVSEAK